MTSPFAEAFEPKDAAKALRLPIGAASPLWLMFAGAASAGVAYWWFSRWRTVTNLEALLPEPAPVATAALEGPTAEPLAETVAEAVVEAPAAVVAEAAEVVIEPAVEAAPIVETAVPAGEAEAEIAAAPAELAAEAVAPAPKPKPKAAPAKAASAPRTAASAKAAKPGATKRAKT